ncbi:MAG: Family finger-like domain protein, partial [Rhizobacter sp.]|nr:Family finger-like domain protein [Rhizobacter sp.]
MSLATRCTACGTVFRVVQDQLKVSEGWVRCGKCQAVFSAMDGLFDLDLKAAAALPAGNGSGFAPSPAVATPADHAPSGIVAPDRSGNTLFEQPFFAPPVQGASVWRGKRSAGERTRLGSRAEGLGPLSLPEQPPAPPQDRFGARADADLFDDDTADSAGALQIQPIDEEDAPFVLRRPAIEARAFEAPPSSRDLPGADALRRATAERDAQTETMPATFDRANAEDWRPSESGPPLADIAAARGLHIDLLIDDADATAGAATAVPAGPHARQAASSTPPRPVVSPDSHVLG